MKKYLLVFFVALFILPASCTASTISNSTEVPVSTPITIEDLFVDRSYYKPGEKVKLTVVISSPSASTNKVRVVLRISALFSEIYSDTQEVTIPDGALNVDFTYQPPVETPRGYGVNVQLVAADGTVLASSSSAFDVLQNWTQNPRYGFLTDFYPERTDALSTMALLNHYHINGLQFYDWMYRHEQFLTDHDPYYDLWSPNPKSINIVAALIEAAHTYGIAAMPYTAVYGSSRTYALENLEMVLYTVSGAMYEFGGDKMMIMDPRPDSPWTAHLMEQFKDVLTNTHFDGIHIDQYGDPKVGYDQDRNRYDLAPALVDFVNNTKDLTDGYSKDDAVVFNLVNNWPVEDMAPSREDFVYIEVWSPNTWFTELHNLIVMSQKLSGGKSVVLACYIDPTFENTAILNEAIIFASGGGHIELGENNGMLSEAYFPNYKVISASLSKTLQDYYDFTVRYQNLTGPGTSDASIDYLGKINIEGVSTSASQMKNFVWPLVRESGNSTTINLVNFLGVEQIEWTENVPNEPDALQMFQMAVDTSKQAEAVWFATPDHPETVQQLAFEQRSGKITITVPSLDYWSMVVIDWAK